uniref:Uncharacterized protein n=1 Tax=Knipowitschia caucasica TaxID=637954 RepID=A0AAV2L3U5_KNICA
MLLIDYSSAFNNIIPSKSISKLTYLGTDKSRSNWIYDFLTKRPQVVRIGRHTLFTIEDGDHVVWEYKISSS